MATFRMKVTAGSPSLLMNETSYNLAALPEIKIINEAQVHVDSFLQMKSQRSCIYELFDWRLSRLSVFMGSVQLPDGWRDFLLQSGSQTQPARKGLGK